LRRSRALGNVCNRRFTLGIDESDVAERPISPRQTVSPDSSSNGCIDFSAMPRDPNIPDAFDVYTLVLLRRPPGAPQMSDQELDALQARHLAYRAELHRQGKIVVNGPLAEQSDISLRGLSIFACGLEEATRLSDGDPSVQAGRLAYDLMEWWVAAGTLAFPEAKGPVGDTRAMPDD
jgi:uncharacterized protein YciI